MPLFTYLQESRDLVLCSVLNECIKPEPKKKMEEDSLSNSNLSIEVAQLERQNYRLIEANFKLIEGN